MAGNSQRHGGVRKTHKKGATKGSGGIHKRSLAGRGPTPKAEDRVYHPAHKRKIEKARRDSGRHVRDDSNELVVGRNPVVECLKTKVPAIQLFVAMGVKSDERLKEAMFTASRRSIPITEVARHDLDRMTGNGMHQGIGLQVPPFTYCEVADIIAAARQSATPGLVVCLDNITDPRNLGAVIRSTAAFGGHGVVIPARRSASVTAVAWRTSAGTAARLPVAKATNMTRALQEFQSNGYQVVGLDAEGAIPVDEYEATTPTVVVVGSEGKGISRLVAETCDQMLTIPTVDWVESLNASVAAGVVLAEFARQRRVRS